MPSMHPAAANSLFAKPPAPIGRWVVLSIVGHVALFVLVLAWGMLFKAAPLDLDQKPIHASLVRLGKPRDQKMLPKKEEPPPPPPPPKAEEAPPAPTPPAPAPPKTAVAVPGLKPPEKTAKQSGAKEGDHRKDLFKAFSKLSKSTPHEDLEGAADGDPTGDSATAEGERYYALLSAQVKRYYDVSDTISDQERLRLKALVHLCVGRAGQLLSVKMGSGSGNDLFDGAVLAAIRRAAPFPPPPDKLRETLQGGVTLAFKP